MRSLPWCALVVLSPTLALAAPPAGGSDRAPETTPSGAGGAPATATDPAPLGVASGGVTTGPGEAGSATPAPPPPPPEEITVLGNKASQATGSAHVIRREQLDRYRYDDPHQVLMGVPGVYVRGEDGFGLRPNIGIRGATSDRSKKLALMEDGVLFAPAPYSAPAAYYVPIMARMRAVRVVKGSSAVASHQS